MPARQSRDRRTGVRRLAGSAKDTSRIGVLGTSLGSCVAFIAAAHEPRILIGIFNHVSMYFCRRGVDGPLDAERAAGLHGECHTGRVAPLLERDQSRPAICTG